MNDEQWTTARIGECGPPADWEQEWERVKHFPRPLLQHLLGYHRRSLAECLSALEHFASASPDVKVPATLSGLTDAYRKRREEHAIFVALLEQRLDPPPTLQDLPTPS